MSDPGRGRGRPAELSAELIVDAATELADDGGLGAVSMSTVAKRLGCSPMALYRHVDSKESLLTAMVDRVFGDPPDSGDGDWREGLRLWVGALMDNYREHDWVLDVPVTGPPAEPNALAWMDRALAVLDGQPLAPLEKLSTLMVLSGYVRNEVSLARALDRARTESGITGEQEGARFEQALDAVRGRLPHIDALVAEGLFAMPSNADTDEDSFMVDFGLERILDGIGALIAARR